jgi:hypothetical protein
MTPTTHLCKQPWRLVDGGSRIVCNISQLLELDGTPRSSAPPATSERSEHLGVPHPFESHSEAMQHSKLISSDHLVTHWPCMPLGALMITSSELGETYAS